VISIGLPAIKPFFLAEAVQSVLAQRFDDFELIIQNDRGDSRVRDIVQSFSDPRLRYFEGSSPLSVVENWNTVLSYARGEYFVLFSDDDRYDPGFLDGMNDLIARFPGCNIFHCRVRKIDSDGKTIEVTALCPEYETGLEFIRQRMSGSREQFAPEFLARTSALRDAGGFVNLPLAWGSDDLTWFGLAMGRGIAFHPEPLADWRQSPYQISESGDMEVRLSAVEEYARMVKTMIDHYQPSNEAERDLCWKIMALVKPNADRQKAYLVAVNASKSSFGDHLLFFKKNQRKYGLKLSWYLYSVYVSRKR
jgi:glycosyltransferase involved in cell wall biosynthesis